jgi:hypothetical protein
MRRISVTSGKVRSPGQTQWAPGLSATDPSFPFLLEVVTTTVSSDGSSSVLITPDGISAAINASTGSSAAAAVITGNTAWINPTEGVTTPTASVSSDSAWLVTSVGTSTAEITFSGDTALTFAAVGEVSVSGVGLSVADGTAIFTAEGAISADSTADGDGLGLSVIEADGGITIGTSVVADGDSITGGGPVIISADGECTVFTEVFGQGAFRKKTKPGGAGGGVLIGRGFQWERSHTLAPTRRKREPVDRERLVKLQEQDDLEVVRILATFLGHN